MIFSALRRLHQPLQLLLQPGDGQGGIVTDSFNLGEPLDYEKAVLLQHGSSIPVHSQRRAGPRPRSSFSRCSQRLPEEDEIRLLRLNRQVSGHVSGSLKVFSLQDVPEFYALSYAWGKQKPTCKIQIDGEDLHITPSLRDALRQLSCPNGLAKQLSSDYIWIDQICIDQSHAAERRHQVTLMGSVYSKALRTIIWLGEDKASIAEPAFAFCHQVEALYLRDQVTPEGGVAVPYVPVSVFLDKHIPENNLPPLTDRRWKAFNTLLSNTWFTRLWVQQEAILSREDPAIVLGSRLCSFQTLARAYAWLDARDFHHEEMITREGENVKQLFQTREFRARGIKKELGCMLDTMSQGTQAKDPRDKVFGLLGVARSGEEGPQWFDAHIHVDYSPEYTAPHAYMDAARDTILRNGTLAILAGPKLRNEHIRDCSRSFGRQGKWPTAPSWIPSFDQSFQPRTEFTAESLTKLPDVSGNDSGTFLMLGWRGNCYASKGRHVEIVTDQSDTASVPNGQLRRKEKIAAAGLLMTSTLSVRGLLVDSVLFQQEVTTGVASYMQTYNPIRYFSQENSIAHSMKHVNSIRRQFGWSPFLYYLWHTTYSGLRKPCVFRLWESALQLTDRSPEDLARAVFIVATSCFHPTTTPYSKHEWIQFNMWLRDKYSLGRGEGIGMKRLRKKGLGHAADWLKTVDAPEYDDLKRAFNVILTVSMWSWANLKRFFVTKNGRLGIGPTGMNEGDKLCVLFGGGVPFVLRRHEGHWLMIGEAYVEGYEAGQAIDACEKGDLKEEVFDIH